MHSSDSLLAELRRVTPSAVVGVGDNVLDCYVHEQLAYPGGNALNVAAYSALLFGSRAGYVGIFGNDRFAGHLRGVLSEIEVDASRSRVADGQNGMAFVALDDDGDRRFLGSNWGGVQAELRLRMTPFDLEYFAGYRSVHTSAYSSIDQDLPAIAEQNSVSFDFSTERGEQRIGRLAPHLGVAFFSGEGLTDAEVDQLGAFAASAGAGHAVVTLGSRGARAFERGRSTSVGIREVEAVDALGAGDAFITGYLAARDAGADLDGCLAVASTAGAAACLYRGAFGYAVEAGSDALAQMTRVYEPQ
jgi:fructoselysine 6-kinase